MSASEARPQELADLLAGMVQGSVPIGDLAGLTTDDKVKILQYGLAQMKVGKNEQAVTILEGLVALDHGNPLFREYLGLAYERADRLTDALAQYDAHVEGLKTLGRPDRLFEGYLLRARLHAKLGDLDAAATDLAEAKAHEDGTQPALQKERALLEQALAGGAS